ncbi:MAG: phosphoribosylanthranilate isomerase [Ignavibacteriales bacterium]|nr:phosphoribosylanthranilate isomerase [Ignavibacteriales bacterium]
MTNKLTNELTNKPFVKICGITNFEDALYCTELGANYLGFIFYERSPRNISIESAKEIVQQFPKEIKKVGVFVNKDSLGIKRIIENVGLDMIQLSGNEKVQDCFGFDVPVMKSLSINSQEDFEYAKQFSVEAILVDSKTENEFGGTGLLSNWEMAKRLKSFHEIFLAGGLNPGNIRKAIATVQPFAVDVNSGVEKSPGKKDREKIKILFQELNAVSNF